MLRLVVYPVCTALSFAAAPAFADWGSIAVNPGSYDWAYSAGWRTKGDARDRALAYCRDNAGSGSRCEVVLTTRKCGGLARGLDKGKPRFFVAEAGNRDAAANTALSACQSNLGASCETRHKFCANDL